MIGVRSFAFFIPAAMANVPPRLLRSLERLRCSIFQTMYNPESKRTGAKYLKARLRGPSMVEYYPERYPSIGDLNRTYPGWNLVDIHEVRRNISIQEHKDRGKGAPKKAKDESTCRWYSSLNSELNVIFCQIGRAHV